MKVTQYSGGECSFKYILMSLDFPTHQLYLLVPLFIHSGKKIGLRLFISIITVSFPKFSVTVL